MGIRAIPFDSIKVGVEEAFGLALKKMRETNGGDKFVGTIQMFWPLTAPGVSREPSYIFTTNAHNVIHVGAYTGEVAGP